MLYARIFYFGNVLDLHSRELMERTAVRVNYKLNPDGFYLKRLERFYDSSAQEYGALRD